MYIYIHKYTHIHIYIATEGLMHCHFFFPGIRDRTRLLIHSTRQLINKNQICRSFLLFFFPCNIYIYIYIYIYICVYMYVCVCVLVLLLFLSSSISFFLSLFHFFCFLLFFKNKGNPSICCPTPPLYLLPLP
ncbi:hypothetical protein, unlikely [Trypanosoma brucei gambiense DAL972]|uniref:Uncharacterized protein n=1 Tax=Trypanosoma brucei gambiense (strain MHOM/CI/86/DAL972) TaxID=679716 RepID=C9ZTJ3_TRYB9|nr:hypothetical protein, unlikely [Trypanosoma brucei gambiense DAL972]CBH12728.1 hypothetical protein, unlikely [Trypanosoma brucei gambiense DAL972]|eukprot:XP_011775008.1 hypothetical protein, unlikely [Trypanosoma brucei gambiense DAL972]